MWFLLAPLSLVVTMVAILLAPILALFVQDDGYLPRLLWLFQTPDSPAIGDAQYQIKQMQGVESKWWMATCWLARNPSQGFDHLCGAPIRKWFIYRCIGDEQTNNTPLHNGWLFRTIDNPDGKRYWQFLLVRKWSDSYCLKINLGWKLWREIRPEFAGWNGQTRNGVTVPDLLAGQTRQLVCTFNPFTKFTAV